MKRYMLMEKRYTNIRDGHIIELPDNVIMFDKHTHQSGKSEWTTYIEYLIPIDEEEEKNDDEEYKRMVEIRDETGLPISRQMNLKLKGYKIVEDEIKDVK